MSKSAPANKLPSRYASVSSQGSSSRPLPSAPVPLSVNPKGNSLSPMPFAHSSVSTLPYTRSPVIPEAPDRGFRPVPSPAYAPSVQSFDSDYSQTSTVFSSLTGPYPRQTSEKFHNDNLDLDETELLLTSYRDREDDDELHQPSASDLESGRGTIFTRRGLANVGFTALLLLALVFLFAGYPILTHFQNLAASKNLGTQGLGGTNASGQVPEISNHFALVDPDTPQSAYIRTSFEDQSQWELVFSDEFNTDNRTFYPGDDPYWEAVDLHYYETDDFEYYDPSAVTTQGGSLAITMTNTPNHGLNYMSGMLQSWNKFCFTGGYVEVRVSLPGTNEISGLWPAVWTMGNLGRAGYGSTTDGTWPYSYDACDVGTLKNQSLNGVPDTSTMGTNGKPLSFLPGQRLSACTCPGEHHPGPVKDDGSFVGRSAPEIDILEAIINGGIGQVSQSAQFAPFDPGYRWANATGDASVLSPATGDFNTFVGNQFQESTSGLFLTNPAAYSGITPSPTAATYTTYGYEYKPGLDGYITWVNDGSPSWSVGASAVAANSATNISARAIPQEPMYLLANLAISPTFGVISDFLVFPAVMYIDYIRVYQDPKAKNIGCSPPDFPTEDYINSLPDMYNNYNLTTFEQAGQTNPRSSLVDGCN